jgi:hypothetical protein
MDGSSEWMRREELLKETRCLLFTTKFRKPPVHGATSGALGSARYAVEMAANNSQGNAYPIRT